MPGGDRTGPMGAGPMTGRAAGYCAGYEVPGYANPAPGGGFGRGFGRGFGAGMGYGAGRGGGGRGWRNRYYATGLPGWARYGYGYGAAPAPRPPAAPAPGAEKQFLEQEASDLKARLDDIARRLSEIEGEPAGNAE